MRRTASRPLPSGQLTPTEALRFGLLLCVAGAVDLAITGGFLPCLLGVFTCLSYLLAYTPLKTRTVWATFIGAIPGAIPPMMAGPPPPVSWTRRRGCSSPFSFSGNSRISTPSPGCTARITPARHPHAPRVDKDGTRTFRQIILYAASLVGVSLLPAIMGFAECSISLARW